MNKVLIIDASPTDGRIMSGLLTRAGYEPVVAESIEAGKVEAAKLPPGAVIVTAMRLPDGSVRELINWLKTEGFSKSQPEAQSLSRMYICYRLRNNRCCCIFFRRNILMSEWSAPQNRSCWKWYRKRPSAPTFSSCSVNQALQCTIFWTYLYRVIASSILVKIGFVLNKICTFLFNTVFRLNKKSYICCLIRR